MEIPDSPNLTRGQQEELQAAAEELAEKLQNSGLSPGTPEFRQLRASLLSASESEFRRKYGQHAWIEHHIQAYHLSHGSGTASP